MRILALALFLAVVAACAPAADPSFVRDGEQVTITVEANQTLYDTTLSVINASTDDERCVQLGDTDLGCRLGTVPEGETVHVTVASEGGLSCVAYAYLSPGQLTSYRPYPCSSE